MCTKYASEILVLSDTSPLCTCTHYVLIDNNFPHHKYCPFSNTIWYHQLSRPLSSSTFSYDLYAHISQNDNWHQDKGRQKCFTKQDKNHLFAWYFINKQCTAALLMSQNNTVAKHNRGWTESLYLLMKQQTGLSPSILKGCC